MTVLQTTPLSPDAIKVRWKEPYVTGTLNQKALAVLPRGTFRGFLVVPAAVQPPRGITIQRDVVGPSGLSIANVLDVPSIGSAQHSITLVVTTDITLDLSAGGFTGATVFIALDAQFVPGAATSAQIKVVDAAELTANPDLILLAKVNVPLVGNILTSHINLAYRDAAGDSEPQEARAHYNQIFNSTFEATAAGWTNSGFDSVTASTDFAHVGGYSLKLVKGVAAVCTATTGPMAVVPGFNYRARVWLHSPGGLAGGNGGKYQVGFFDATGAQIGTWTDIESAIGLATAGFVERKNEVLAPTLALTAQVRILFDNCSGTLYADDVEFSSHRHDEQARAAVFGGPGVSADAFHSHTALGLTYAGSAPNTWADASTLPASALETAIDNIVIALGGSSGAARIGNAANKVATNTFTLLNTFNSGIALGAAGAVSWPNWNFQQITANDLYLNHNASLHTQFQPGVMYVNDPAGSVAGLLGADALGSLLGSGNDWPIQFSIDGVKRWKIDNLTDALQGVGGNKPIQNVLDPVNPQDAATKAYVDANAGTPVNAVINGGVEIWQRGTLVTSAISVGSSALGYNFHSYCADRFYAQTRDDAGGQPINVDIRPFTVTGLENTRRAVRIRNMTAASSSQFYQVVQEIDRDTVLRLRGKKVSWRVAVRRGTTSPSNTDCFVELYSNTGTASQRLAAYTGGAGVGSNYLPGVSISDTTFTYLTGTSAAVIPAAANGMSILVGAYQNGGGPADGTDYLEFGEFSIVSGEAPPSEFSWTAGDIGGEIFLCERFYEKSYPFLIPPATGGATTGYEKFENNNLAAQLLPGVRFKTRKRTTPTITFYTPVAGTLGSWDETLSPGAYAITANAIADTGFYATQGSIGVGGNWQGHWVADAEI